ncbi:SGNH/GDSL hydrolase family protein [Microbacteriaceae bacterium VKM Ac-2855]|nr:SGNH/GDSL hydrolase family protein [Microbacteriaceae bacterium VKM Ac-2855]
MRPRSLALALIALLGATALSGCASAAPAVDVSSTPGAPVVAFYGDSYTLGTGATDASKRWSSIICRERGWTEVNPSVNGLGFVNNRDRLAGTDLVEQVIDAEPDIVFVTMGLNDNFSWPDRADDIRTTIDADLTTLRNALPDARFVVVQPFWYTDEQPDSLLTISGWVSEAAARIRADYIDGSKDWIRGHPEWMASDGLHPNDDGYAAMAERMDAELTAIGL